MHEDKLAKLCNTCKLHVAKETIGDNDVIDVLGKVGRGFCNHLHDDTMTQDMRQTVSNANNDSEALRHIRVVSWQMFHYYTEIITN